ncbi:MAG: hypothetical protein ACSHYA_12380 [Opitutaceae bacterium]
MVVRLLLLIPFLNFSLLSAGGIEGVIELKNPKQRRATARYAGNSDDVEKPAPFVGVVYLTQEGMDAKPPQTEPAVMAQKGLQFFPSVLPIQLGSSVKFPNQDNTYHNVFSYSPEKTFDLGRYAKDDKPPIVQFDEAGEVRVFCEVHEHMRAIILVLETPYFTATDPAGAFSIADVPPGEYTLNIWRINQRLVTKPISITDNTEVIKL